MTQGAGCIWFPGKRVSHRLAVSTAATIVSVSSSLGSIFAHAFSASPMLTFLGYIAQKRLKRASWVLDRVDGLRLRGLGGSSSLKSRVYAGRFGWLAHIIPRRGVRGVILLILLLVLS